MQSKGGEDDEEEEVYNIAQYPAATETVVLVHRTGQGDDCCAVMY